MIVTLENNNGRIINYLLQNACVQSLKYMSCIIFDCSIPTIDNVNRILLMCSTLLLLLLRRSFSFCWTLFLRGSFTKGLLEYGAWMRLLQSLLCGHFLCLSTLLPFPLSSVAKDFFYLMVKFKKAMPFLHAPTFPCKIGSKKRARLFLEIKLMLSY